MNWFSVQVNAATVASAVSSGISLIIALIAIKRARNLKPEFAPEGIAREMLADRKSQYRTFRFLKHHLGGFSDDELRKILVRAGGVRLTAEGQEVWGLLSRNRECLNLDEIKETPATEAALDLPAQEQNDHEQEAHRQEEPEPARDHADPFERLRAEMMKLGTLECVKPAAGQG
jgi:hypothetical protein